MQLKIGELASRTRLTTRTLRYYDTIGLVVPSTRSERGYRLYNLADIGRLHQVQALRQLGLPLEDIAATLKGSTETISGVIDGQIEALDRQLAQIGHLKRRLIDLKKQFLSGGEPDLPSWLGTLEQMVTYGRHFTQNELAVLRRRGKSMEKEWSSLITAVREAMRRRLAPECPEMQLLAGRWSDYMIRQMNGDRNLLARWDKMYREEPLLQGVHGVDRELIEFISSAIQVRFTALLKYFTTEELGRLRPGTGKQFNVLAKKLERFSGQRNSPADKKVQAARKTWDDLLDQVVSHDPNLRKTFIAAFEGDPILRSSSPLTPKARKLLRDARLVADALRRRLG